MSNKPETMKYTPLLRHWKKENGKVLLTNDFGGRVKITEEEFNALCKKEVNSESNIPACLLEQGFISEMLDVDSLGMNWAQKHSCVFLPPILHIMVMTTRCNMQCVYCQAGSPGKQSEDYDMKWETAKKSVDFAFNTPSYNLSFEFQGGEPLLNWEVIKKTVEYIRSKQIECGKNAFISLISNFMLMDEEKAEFLLKNEVSICSSLDGPRSVHSKNRRSKDDSSYDTVRKWLQYFRKRYEEQAGSEYRIFKPGAIVTVTKNSIGHAKEIIDEYLSLGLSGMYMRPVSQIGFADKNWNNIGISPDEFIKFYTEALTYILEVNRKGTSFYETACKIFCSKILNSANGGNYDVDSPCGAGTGQIAYNYDGNIYTCDEGRMLAMQGDDLFCIGNVDDPVEKVLTADAVRGCKCASLLDSQPMCSRCAYMPYCGTCPVFNYSSQGSLAGNMATNARCKISKGQLDLIFKLLEDKTNEEIIEKWLQK
ncbi:MAG: His-Xaa-Ser system radical SAM maturase HxsB [Elusimicrobiales bacterium]|nr:His-Xaa-Ser system radical SAM maturase HxsB [Elusimicrobiales bacterium]